MNPTSAARVAAHEVDWPADVPIAAERVLAGSPTASTFVMHETDERQLGLWRVTPGEFTTVHTGYIEFIHVIAGRGRLIDEDEVVTELAPGVTFYMPEGWKGRWVVDETIVKVFTVLYG